MQKLISAR